MMESGMKIGCMEEEYCIMPMENQPMMESGRMINSKVRVFYTMMKSKTHLILSIIETLMK
jgi:hypothetical protein